LKAFFSRCRGGRFEIFRILHFGWDHQWVIGNSEWPRSGMHSKRQMQIFFFSRKLKTCLISCYIPHSRLWPFRVELQFSNFHHAQEASGAPLAAHLSQQNSTPEFNSGTRQRRPPLTAPLLRSHSSGGVEAEPQAVIVAGVAKRRQAP
jgi:hypothetical protein